MILDKSVLSMRLVNVHRNLEKCGWLPVIRTISDHQRPRIFFTNISALKSLYVWMYRIDINYNNKKIVNLM